MQVLCKKKVFRILFLSCTIVLFLSGCGKKPEGVEVISYNLGEASFTERETKIPYDVEGMMGIPEQDNAPVVFILHGSHALNNSITNPYYKGFEYLVEELANQGYLAISINVNRAYSFEPVQGDELFRMKEIFKEHYKQLTLANKGKKIYEYNLKDKADLSKINMVGHSRGGQDITTIIGDKEFKDISFQSAVKISAAGNYSLRETYADIPTTIINSQFDGDVVSLDSMDEYYYVYLDDRTRKSPIMSAYLYGGNHNNFNSQVTQDELFDYGDQVTYLEPEKQREFLMKYVADYLNIYNKDQPLFEVFNEDTSQRYGIDFMYSIHQPMGKRILTPDEYMEGIQVKDVDLKYVVASNIIRRDTSGGFKIPGGYDKVPLYKISWDKKGGSLTIPIDSMFFEFSKEKILSLNMAVDSSDKRNSMDTATRFDFIFTDVEGKELRIPMSSQINAALKYQPGNLEKIDVGYEKWRYFTPLGTTGISLKDLEDILIIDNIVSLKIVPTSNQGSIMLGGIDLYENN